MLVMRPGVLRPEYWNAAHQLYFAVGGNGARAGGHGTKVFCINIYTGDFYKLRVKCSCFYHLFNLNYYCSAAVSCCLSK